MTAVIEMAGISRSFVMGDHEVRALDHVDLCVSSNEFVSIRGPSGSGKSTLMNVIGLLEKPSHGRYLLNGRDTAGMDDTDTAQARNMNIGFIFQSFNLIARLSALDNVIQPLIYRGMPAKDRAMMAADVLARVGLGERLDHRPNQLSGGQRQRVAIARAICGKPALLLADEPTGNLDTEASNDVMDLLRQLHREGNTIVIVTHDDRVAHQCERTIEIIEGKVVSDLNNKRAA